MELNPPRYFILSWVYTISIFTNSYTSLRTETTDLKGYETFSVREFFFADAVKIWLKAYFKLVEKGITHTSLISLAKATKYFPMVKFGKFWKNAKGEKTLKNKQKSTTSTK